MQPFKYIGNVQRFPDIIPATSAVLSKSSTMAIITDVNGAFRVIYTPSNINDAVLGPGILARDNAPVNPALVFNPAAATIMDINPMVTDASSFRLNSAGIRFKYSGAYL